MDKIQNFLFSALIFNVWLFLINCSTDQSNGPRVTLTTGHVLDGFLHSTPSNLSANVFLGIPYAQPPIGALRFQKTQSLLLINKSATNASMLCKSYKPTCWQNHSMVGDERITEMNEDCLYLNVYSGLECQNGGCPVLYYIHGGAFEFDSPVMFPVDVLVDNFASTDLVFVTVAYRLGIFGFWSTGNDEAPGNYALYDVLEGLKWVNREIKAFGGDPSKVTIMGQSSGAALVSLLTLTPKSAGLFNQAILMSRSTMVTENIKQYQNIASNLGCIKNENQSITDCMRELDAKTIVDAYWAYEQAYGHHLSAARIDGPDGLFPYPLPWLLENRRPIDAIVGTVADEYGPDKLINVNATAKDVSQLCKKEINNMNLKHKKLLIAECERRYVLITAKEYRNDSNFSVWANQMSQFKNDVWYFGPAFAEATSMAGSGGRVFLYSFDYVKRETEGIGPWHAFDLSYVLGIHPFEFDERDKEIKSIYTTFFVNFTKYGHPTPPLSTDSAPVWKPLQNPPFDMNYLSINLPSPTMEFTYHYDAVLFWNYIVPTIGEVKNFYHSSLELSQADLDIISKSNDELIKPKKRFTLIERNQQTIEPIPKNHSSQTLMIGLLVGACAAMITVVVAVVWRHRRAKKSKTTETYPIINDENANLLARDKLAVYQTF